MYKIELVPEYCIFGDWGSGGLTKETVQKSLIWTKKFAYLELPLLENRKNKVQSTA